MTSSIKNGIRSLKVSNRGNIGALTPQECLPYGLDSVPVKGARGFYAPTETVTSPDVMVGYENKQQKALPGEFRGYATDDDGVFKFNFWLRKDGSILIGDSDNPADYVNHFAQYEALATAYNELKGKHNDLVTAFNTHVHPVSGAATTGPTPIPGSIPATPSAGDITPAKLDKIKTK